MNVPEAYTRLYPHAARVGHVHPAPFGAQHWTTMCVCRVVSLDKPYLTTEVTSVVRVVHGLKLHVAETGVNKP